MAGGQDEQVFEVDGDRDLDGSGIEPDEPEHRPDIGPITSV